MTRALPSLLSLEDALAALPVRKTRRWLNEFLRKTRTDPQGRPLYRQAGRDRLVHIDRLIEALPCPSSSERPARAKRRTSKFAGRTSESEWKKAAALTGDPSLELNSSDSRRLSSEASTRRGKPRLVVNNQRS